MNPVPYTQPANLRVKPPVPKDGTKGFILSRSLDVHGRPISFAYTGASPVSSGSSIRLDSPLLRKSLNYKSVAAGNAYPLFYDTLFGDLRATLAAATVRARAQSKGLWASDRTNSGLTVSTLPALEQDGVLFPKLFRRLGDYLKNHPGPAGFLAWLAQSQEQVLDLTNTSFTHFDNLLTVSGNTISMQRQPEQIVFVSAKALSTVVNPWLAH